MAIISSQFTPPSAGFKVLSFLKKTTHVYKLISDPNLTLLGPFEIIKWLDMSKKYIEEALKRPLQSLKVQQLLQPLMSFLKNIPEILPMFDTIGFIENDKVTPPSFRFRAIKEIVEYHDYYGVLVSDEINKKWELQRHYIADDHELNLLFDALKKEASIPWNYDDEGCFARCLMVCQWLISFGIEPKSLTKKYVFGVLKFIDGSGQEQFWKYHVACVVTLKNGEKRVIDLSLSPNKPLNEAEWLKKNDELAINKNNQRIKEVNWDHKAIAVHFSDNLAVMELEHKDFKLYTKTLRTCKLYEVTLTTPEVQKIISKHIPKPSIEEVYFLMLSKFKSEDAIAKLDSFLSKKSFVLITSEEITDISIKAIKAIKDSNEAKQVHMNLLNYLSFIENLPKKDEFEILKTHIKGKISEIVS